MLARLSPHANLWLERDEQVVLSRWRVRLLEAIEETGSISGAAKRVGVQYRLAWDRLEEMENGLGVALASKPLVATAIAQGRLVAPFDIAVGQKFAYYLVVPQAVAERPAVQAFRKWLLEEAKAEEPERAG